MNQSQVNVPSSSQSKQSNGNQHQRSVPLQSMMIKGSGGQAPPNEQSEVGITHGSLTLNNQSLSAHQASSQNGKGPQSAVQNGVTSMSNAGSTTGNYQTPLGSRQFESYLGRK